jgi:hypothetical protein
MGGVSGRRIRRWLLPLVVCGLAIGLGAFLLPHRGDEAASAAPVPLRTLPDTDLNPYGANFFLEYEAEPWKIDKTLQMAREAGLGWVKQQFPWEDIELRKGRFWDDRLNKSTWDKYDRIVDTARKNNLEVIARLDRPPPWTRKDNAIPQAPPDNFDDYGDFVQAVVEHFKGRVHYYQLWNEPNIYPEWGNRPVDPEAYARLLKIGYARAKAVDPNVRILSAPLAQTLETGPTNLSELLFLDRMYQAGARDAFDILFANGYGFDRSPDDPPDPGVLNFQRVQLVREIMVRNGDGAKPVWFNEVGWNAAPDTFPKEKLIWQRVPEAQQAEWTVAAIKNARALWDWAGVFCVWYFRQAGQIPAERADYYFRMVDVGFTPRPVYNLVKKATEGIGTAGPGAYQESNPAVTYQGDWEQVASADASGGLWRVAHNVGDSATISFRGSDLAVLTRKGPEAPTIYVTLDGREANRLPRDRQGRSFADLYAATPQPRAVVQIAQDLPMREHVVRITLGGVAQGGETAFVLDGFEVGESDATDWVDLLSPAAPWVAGAALVAAGAALLLARRRRRASAE